MIHFFDYYKESFRFALFNLEYRMIPDEGPTKLYFKDDFEITKTEDGLDMLYRRRLCPKPEEEPSLQVVYKIIFEKSDKADPSDLTCEEIHNAFYDNALGALDPIAARMSLLIGEIMFAEHDMPMILPPNVIKDNL